LEEKRPNHHVACIRV